MKEPEAETHSLDEDRDPTDAAVVRSLAARVAAQYGGDLSRMRRALGYSNATWVGGGLAVRIANTPRRAWPLRSRSCELCRPRSDTQGSSGWARSRVTTGS